LLSAPYFNFLSLVLVTPAFCAYKGPLFAVILV
jgi:hypothetical protein